VGCAMWCGFFLLLLSHQRAISGEEYAVNEFGESSYVTKQFPQVTQQFIQDESRGNDRETSPPGLLLETSVETSMSLLENNSIERSYPNLIRVTPSNFFEIFQQQPFSVVLIHDELTAMEREHNQNQPNNILQSFISAAGDESLSSEKIKPQFLYLNARSNDCHSLIGDQDRDGIWQVRRSYYEEETIYPTCYEEGKAFIPQLWLFYWRDSHLMSPLRLSSPLLPEGELSSFSIDSITSKMITDSLLNLMAMDLSYVT
jgi:hypothetical protein